MNSRQIPALVATILILATGATRSNEATEQETHSDFTPRSGFTSGTLSFPLRVVWSHRPSGPPRPAWPAPARGSYWQRLTSIEPRVVDDRTFRPICVEGSVLYASSADDSLHCLDGETGERRWRFTADGPVRYAPFVTGGVAYFGSDDGCVYAVDIATGNLNWKHRTADDLRIVGNGRVISAWPVRTGLLVENGIVYATAGLFPAQGVYLSALAAGDGNELWRRRYELSFQGYLMSSRGRIYAPTGRAKRVALQASSGTVDGVISGQSGSYGAIVEDWIFTGRGNNGLISVSHLETRFPLGSVPARHVAGDAQRIYLLGRGKLTAIEIGSFKNLTADLIATGDTLTQRQRRTNLWNDLATWTIDTDQDGALLVCHNAVLIGGKESLRAFDPTTGDEIWKTGIEGTVRAIAAGGERLVASTESGEMFCFAKADATRVPALRDKTPSRRASEAAKPVNDQFTQFAKHTRRTTKGICLVCGLVDGALAVEIARNTELLVVAVDRDPDRIASARQLAHKHGLYGHRIAIHQVNDDKLPFTDYVANVVTSERAVYDGSDSTWADEELHRVLRPFGGIQWMGGEPRQRGRLDGAGNWTHQYADSANTANSGDRYVQRDVTLQWFGGPGPNRIVDRHLRSHAPLVSNGILIVTGENALIGVDAYNGTELWHLDLPRSHRYSIPYNAGYVAVSEYTLAIAAGDACWLIDIRDGKRLDVLELADLDHESRKKQWAYTSFVGDFLLAGIQHAKGSRTTPSRELIDADYRNETPVITSHRLLAYSRSSGQVQWRYSGGVIINPTVSVEGDRAYFVEARGASVVGRSTAAFRLKELLSSEAFLVAVDLQSGKRIWDQPLDAHLAACRNILYLQCDANRLIASGSYRGEDNDTHYRLAVLDATNGKVTWRAEHSEGKRGAFTHGEQVHHPVIVGNTLIAEPVMYDLATGKRISPDGLPDDWRIVRPGHSCGTMSASANCLFFRANNPTLFDLQGSSSPHERFVKLAPSRPGCWINIIPAAGLVLIPEASASCVCDYPLQTSMAFLPRPIDEQD